MVTMHYLRLTMGRRERGRGRRGKGKGRKERGGGGRRAFFGRTKDKIYIPTIQIHTEFSEVNASCIVSYNC